MPQFFEQSDFDSFIDPKPKMDDAGVRAERIKVKKKLQHLHVSLLPHIQAKNWDLHPHRMPEHYVSSHHFVTLPNGIQVVNHIDSMWLHFGKSAKQLDFLKLIGGYDWKKYDDDEYYNAFYLHTRIQFYINKDSVRSWLLIATDKNYYDRSEFLRALQTGKKSFTNFCKLLQPLQGKNFFYEVDGQVFDLNSSFKPDDLLAFIKKDRHGVYSGIVKQYDKSDSAISDANIVSEFKECLNLLYPLYDFVAWRPVI